MSQRDFSDTAIDPTDLNKELEQQTASFVHVGQMFNKAEEAFDLYRLRVKQLAAALDEKVRLSYLAEGKKITEAAIEKEIERHPDYVKAMEHQIALNRQKEDAKILMFGWRDRKDMLLQRARNERSELESLQSDKVKSNLRAI